MGGTHLHEDKRVRLDGFEELAEYVVDERHQIFVWLIFRKRFLIRQDGPEQVQGGYLAKHSERTRNAQPALGETRDHRRRLTWKNRPSAFARTACRWSKLTTRFISSGDVNSL
jgi:hypothetical protein